ncbi:MAG: DNA replication/repair protein RecF [Pyrinomonadaceae bacterium]
MLLETIFAENFRNLTGEIEFGSGLNIIFGENGQGKTNWLEAIYILANARSFKTARLQETINFEADEAIIRGKVRQSKEITREVGVLLKENAKRLSVNGKRETAQRFSTQLYTLLFNSDSLEIVRSSPAARRDFLDSGIVSIYPSFSKTLSDYAKVIKQKNSILSKARDEEASPDYVKNLIEPWNEQLSVLATHIYKARIRFVQRLNEVLEKKLFDKEEITITYFSSLEGKGDLRDFESLLRDRLELRLPAEIYAGKALIGTHRDDLLIRFNGKDLRKFGSSGQQRSALLILLTAKLSVFFEQNKEYPIFLLDDLDAELDYKRIGLLLNYLKGKSQTFVTTSKESFIERFSKGAQVHEIVNGKPV